MTVRMLRPQKAEHVESGVTLGGAGRDAMRLSLGEHTMTIAVDRGDHRMLWILPQQPRWDDGTPLPPDLEAGLQPIIAEISRFWEQEPEFRVGR
jgi:hypothetical protein